MNDTHTDDELMDPQTWNFDAAKIVQPSKPAGAVVSVRFGKDDLATVADAAFERGMKTSEFIRAAAIEAATSEARRPLVAISPVAAPNIKTAQPTNWQRTYGGGRFRIVRRLTAEALGSTSS